MTFSTMVVAVAAQSGSALIAALPLAALAGWVAQSRKAAHAATAIVILSLAAGVAMSLAESAQAFGVIATSLALEPEIGATAAVDTVFVASAGLGLAWAAMTFLIRTWRRP